MAFILGDRVRETSTAPGAGSFTVNGAEQGARSFASVLTSNGDTTWYAATNGTAWETGLLTRTSATVYARTTIFASSNGGAAVNFSTGTVDVSCDLPAQMAQLLIVATQADQEAASSALLLVTPGRQQYHPSAAKVWAAFGAVAGTAGINASYNVTSITDNGVGNFTLNFTTAFATANYGACVGSYPEVAGGVFIPYVFTKAAGSVNILTRNQINANVDPTTNGSCGFTAFGDL